MAHRQAPQIAPWFLGVHTWTRQKCSAGISRTERPTMNTSSASEKRFSIGCMSRILCRFVVMLVCALSLVAPVASRGAELKEETLKTWDTYLQAANLQMDSRQGPFLWVDGEPDPCSVFAGVRFWSRPSVGKTRSPYPPA